MHSVESPRRSNMMKFTVAVLAVLAMSGFSAAYTVPRTGNGALAKEVQDFIDLMPLEKMVGVLLEYISEDREVQGLITYLHSTEFKNLVTDIEAMPEVQAFMNYAQGAGLDIYKLVNSANDYLGLKKLTPPAHLLMITGGIRGLLDDIEALYPTEKINALFREKMASSKVFQELIHHLRSPQAQTVVNKICANENFHNLLVRAQKAGVKVENIKAGIERVLGLQVPCKI